jgi:NNP family nitrate/nitrite transporter-like MFS transporter
VRSSSRRSNPYWPLRDRKLGRWDLCSAILCERHSAAARRASGVLTRHFVQVGILGGTFVPCVSWTTAFFDKNVVGTVNGIAAGLGNAGGGATYAIMVSLYATLRKTMSQHVAWRVAFAVVPVPVSGDTVMQAPVLGSGQSVD